MVSIARTIHHSNYIAIHCVCVCIAYPAALWMGMMIISETRAGPFFSLSFFSQFGTSAGISGIGIFPVLILLNIWSFGIFWRRKKLSIICAGFRCLLLTRANFETLTTPPLEMPMDHTPKIEWKKHEGKKGRKKKGDNNTHTHTHTSYIKLRSQSCSRNCTKKCTVYIFVLKNKKKGKKENGKTIITLSTTSLQIHFLPVSCVSNV